MRYFEIAGGLRVPLSGEEQKVLSIVQDNEGGVGKKEMDERQWEIGRQMVSRGLLRRVNSGDQERVVANDDIPLKRF